MWARLELDAIEGYFCQEGLHLLGELGYYQSFCWEPNRCFSVLSCGRKVSLYSQIAVCPREAVSSFDVFLFLISGLTCFFFSKSTYLPVSQYQFVDYLCLFHSTNFYMFNFSAFSLYFLLLISLVFSFCWFLVASSYPYSCHNVTV